MEELINRFDQLWVVILTLSHLTLQIIDVVYLFGELVGIFSMFKTGNGHGGEKDSGLDGKKAEMLLVIILEAICDGWRGGIERGEFFEVFDDIGEFAIGGGLDDVLLNFVLFFGHLINYEQSCLPKYNQLRAIFSISNEPLEPKKDQLAIQHNRKDGGPSSSPAQPDDSQKQHPRS